jgi:MFS family permease
VFYGWYVVLASFLVMFLTFGCAYSFASFFPSLQHEFQASRATISSVFSIAGFLYFTVGALSGRLADRVGPRWVSLIGVWVVGLGLWVAASASELLVVFIGFGLGIGLGVGFSYVPSVGAVQPWFIAKRGYASGLAVSGIGLGTLVGPLAATSLIDAFGWRTAFVVLGAVTAVFGTVAAAMLHADPAAKGWLPDGRRTDAKQTRQSRSSSTSAADNRANQGAMAYALRTRSFWTLYVSSMFLAVGMFIPFVHLVPFALDQGLSATTGAAILGTVGIGSTVGRFFVGVLADRYGRINVFIGVYAGIVAMLWFWLTFSALPALYLFAFVFGTCYGGYVALAPAISADYFGTAQISTIIGALYTSVGVGTLIGPILAGFIYDRFESYEVAILCAEISAGIALLIVATLPGRKN